ncbi:MEKHLA domain-containing protein [Nocardia brasiliensis]
MLIELTTRSFERFLGRPLSDRTDARWLYKHAPFGLLVHNTEPDPVFVYANKSAQRCFEYTWDEFVGLPSRLSAEPGRRAARQDLLDEVARSNFITGYRDVRITKSGRRFWIEDGIIWNVLDDRGDLVGQAAIVFPGTLLDALPNDLDRVSQTRPRRW